MTKATRRWQGSGRTKVTRRAPGRPVRLADATPGSNASGDGTLHADELQDAGMCPDEEACDTLIRDIDNNGDGRVDFNEYVAWQKKQG